MAFTHKFKAFDPTRDGGAVVIWSDISAAGGVSPLRRERAQVVARSSRRAVC